MDRGRSSMGWYPEELVGGDPQEGVIIPEMRPHDVTRDKVEKSKEDALRNKGEVFETAINPCMVTIIHDGVSVPKWFADLKSPTRQFTVDPELEEAINGKLFQVSASELAPALLSFFKTIGDVTGYDGKSIQVFMFTGKDITVGRLVAAGTRVLDAILYVFYYTKYSHAFNVVMVQASTSVREQDMIKRVQIAMKLLVAAVEVWYNTGGIPDTSNSLSKHIRTKILCGTDITSYQGLASRLSSAGIGPFPAEILGLISLSSLPASTQNKIFLSLAGNKSMKYMVVCLGLDKGCSVDPTALKLFERLGRRALESTCYMDLHPSLQKIQQKIDHFHLRVCNLIMTVLSEGGRKQFLEELGKISSFAKDSAFVNNKCMHPMYSWANLQVIDFDTDLTMDLKKINRDKGTLTVKNGVFHFQGR